MRAHVGALIIIGNFNHNLSLYNYNQEPDYKNVQTTIIKKFNYVFSYIDAYTDLLFICLF